MKKFLKKLFCVHDYEFAKKFHGDEIIFWGYKLSKFKCKKCGKLDLRDYRK